jgi:hypothetical protein
MQKTTLFMFAAALIWSSPGGAVDFRVDIQQGDIQVAGSLETTGATGVLNLGDIIAWDLIATAPDIDLDLTTTNSSILFSGNDLVSTGSQLTFAYGSNDRGLFAFIKHISPDAFSIFCNAAAGPGAFCGEGVTLKGVPPTSAFASVSETVAIASVPEPSTWALMVAGLVALGLMGRRVRRVKDLYS